MKPRPDPTPAPTQTVELPAAASAAPASPPAAQDPDLLVKIIENTRIARDQSQRAAFEAGLLELARELESGELPPLHPGDLEGLINAAIGQIDRNLSEQVDVVIHHPKFQKLEANWRSLYRLVEESFNRSDKGAGRQPP
jgi:type VI secretion system protein ImpC